MGRALAAVAGIGSVRMQYAPISASALRVSLWRGLLGRWGWGDWFPGACAPGYTTSPLCGWPRLSSTGAAKRREAIVEGLSLEDARHREKLCSVPLVLRSVVLIASQFRSG